jgi:protease I
MNQNLQGKTIALLVDMGFEQIEMTDPRQALAQAGAQTKLVSPQAEQVKAWQHTDWGDTFDVDVPLEQANPAQYDALMLPGGVINADNLRTNPQVLEFVQAFFTTGKPVATICHAPWALIDARVIGGRRITSYPSLKADLQNAGAEWVDQEVVVDRGLVSSRKPDDLPAFNSAMIEEFSGQREPERRVSTSSRSSFADGGGAGALGYDSPPTESSHLTNEEYHRSPKPDMP